MLAAEHDKRIGILGDDLEGDKIHEVSLTCLPAEKLHFLQIFSPILVNMELRAKQLRTDHTKLSNFKSITIIYLKHIYYHFLQLIDVLPSQCETGSSQLPNLKGFSRLEKCLNFTFQSWQKDMKRVLNWKSILMIYGKRHPRRITRKIFGDGSYISWDDAARLCITAESFLPVIKNVEEFHFLLSFLKLSYHVRYTEGLFISIPAVVRIISCSGWFVMNNSPSDFSSYFAVNFIISVAAATRLFITQGIPRIIQANKRLCVQRALKHRDCQHQPELWRTGICQIISWTIKTGKFAILV